MMQGVLRVVSGAAFGQVQQLDASRPITIGRAPEADFSISNDPLISSLHCRVSPASDGFWLEDLHSTNGTFINGMRIDRRLLRDGDTVRCGDTEIQVAVEVGGPAAPPKSSPAAPPPPTSATASSAAPTSATAPHRHAPPAKTTEVATSLVDLGPEAGYVNPSPLAIIDRFGLADALDTLPRDGESVDEFVARLASSGNLIDALKFLAAALPKRLAVWWGRECVLLGAQENLAPADKETLDIAAEWCREPSEALRRKAMAAAQAVNCETAAAWVGVGVFWSHGSMGPPEAPPVPPGPELTAKAIAGAVQLAAVLSEPERAVEKHQQFVAAARSIAARDKPWAKAGTSKQ